MPEEGNGAHFSQNAETIFAGVIEAIMYTSDKNNQTLPHVREWLLKPFEDLICLLRDIDPMQLVEKGQEPVSGGRIPSDELAAEAVGVLEELLGSDEAGSFKSTLSRNLKWLSEKQIKNNLSRSDTSLKKLVQSGGTVYIVMRPDRIDDFKSWLRIITQSCISAKIDLGVNQTTQQTLFGLDEFALLGQFKELEKSAGFLRGYNCKMVCVIQNIGQIKQHYAKNWETFLGNAGAIIGFALNDYETEEYFSNRMGKILAWETSYSVNSGASQQGMSGGINDGKTVSQAQRERSVRLPNEVHEQSARETMRAFIIPADSKPFIVERQNYDEIGTNGIYESPMYCQKWELNYGGNSK